MQSIDCGSCKLHSMCQSASEAVGTPGTLCSNNILLGDYSPKPPEQFVEDVFERILPEIKLSLDTLPILAVTNKLAEALINRMMMGWVSKATENLNDEETGKFCRWFIAQVRPFEDFFLDIAGTFLSVGYWYGKENHKK